MNLKKLLNYLLRRFTEKKCPSEQAILLGSKKQAICHFVTCEEFNQNVENSLEKTKEILANVKGNLVINGNLTQTVISRLIKLSQIQNRQFIVVVNDGYNLSITDDVNKAQDLAVIIEETE